MERPTPAQELDEKRAALQWARQIVLPDDLRQTYEQAAAEIAHALTHEVYHVSIQLPHLIYLNTVLISVPRRWLTLRAGNPIDALRRRSSHSTILKNLNNLSHHSYEPAASIVRFSAYLAAKHILFDLVPSVEQIEALCHAPEGVSAVVERLSSYVQWMQFIDQIYPAWTADDLYNAKYSHLIQHLTALGRALAADETQQMIIDLVALWQGGDSLRGLKLLIPYLDERNYRMQTYPVIVIPSQRIPFRPEFVVGACRVEEQRVRKNPQLSQATRWQLISQLDSVLQTFEEIIRDTTSSALSS